MDIKFYYKENLTHAFQVREEVFVNEQGFSKNIEQDNHDTNAWHVVLYDNGAPIATGRIFLQDNNIYSVGRVAVLKDYRSLGVGRMVMNALEEKATQLKGGEIRLNAQKSVAEFYKKLGYQQYGQEIITQGVPHLPMKKTLYPLR